MTLVIELSPEDFEAVEDGRADTLVQRVTAVEIRQAGGLLSQTRELERLDVLGSTLGRQMGAPDSGGPPICVTLTQEPGG